jgi:hypothetical protein
MNHSTKQSIHVLLFIVGVILMIGGIMKSMCGASVVGLIVAAVNLQQWERSRKQSATR